MPSRSGQKNGDKQDDGGRGRTRTRDSKQNHDKKRDPTAPVHRSRSSSDSGRPAPVKQKVADIEVKQAAALAAAGLPSSSASAAAPPTTGPPAPPAPSASDMETIKHMFVQMQGTLSSLVAQGSDTMEKVAFLNAKIDEVKTQQVDDRSFMDGLAQRLDNLELREADAGAARAAAPAPAPAAHGGSYYGPAASAAASAGPAAPNPWANFRPTSMSRPATPGPPAGASPPGDADPCKVWLNGFPRELLADQLSTFASELLYRKAPLNTAKQCRIRAYHLGKSCTITFPSASPAQDFLNTTRDGCGRWDDPKGGSWPISSRPDRSVPARNISKTIGDLWGSVFRSLKDSGVWKEGWKLLTTGARGTLFLAHDHDNTVLFRVKATTLGAETTHQVQPDYSNLAELGIDRAAVDQMVADARTVFTARA